MSFLPKEAVTLTGGCYCEAIRYTIRVPIWENRPPVPGALDTPISATETVQTRIPIIDIDHCNNCRKTSGALVQCWFICPVGWIEWDILSKESPGEIFHLSTIEAVGPSSDNLTSPSTFVTRFNASDRGTRTFCSRCGTTLTYISHQRIGTPEAIVDVTVGSLDRQSLNLAKPDRHAWWTYGVDWIQNLLTKGDGGFLLKHANSDMSKTIEA
ncbi:hypothetical protein LTR99_009050 [Exophiala xenobiotica]|uniref:CENP-V/GFA domain-containing protein n=1 Tax=Vermiconidia calcicola TaxID=1690605 RepID=A0AAV9PYU8_9PEZI|nr:hypothetical protein LTR96_009643 [Exophiala xenobiotica]KAK5532316.1 hypothetical protein LTR25_007849 [Vermiconidia calcicola]KAK5541854.1 hypothetical protein LTR23_005456 [Chaetothyriales sp. CCFEE 6169]KAK5295461.1 hypothetical protein LTR99_009050 [Exophiala xenobiotica]KAK5333689.1 hypothetical protein LTR98_010027 [Exophiala xenobiotica]